MTGMTPYSQGMVGYRDGQPWDYPHTLAGELTSAGYQTINIGKTHFYPVRKHLGYEQLVIPTDYEEWLSQQPGIETEKLAHGVPANSWLGRPNHLPEHQMEETYFVGQALDFLHKRDPTRPFFLTLSFNGPHPPWCPPQIYYDQFIDRDLPKPEIGDWAERHARDARYPLDVNAWRGTLPEHIVHRARAAYFAYLSFLDAQIGRLVERLQRSGLLDNTLIVFTSDHGEMLGDHHLWRKTYAYEASARVPLIAVAPESINAKRNVECDGLVGWEDIMPTFLQAAATDQPESVEGHSILGLLNDPSDVLRPFYHGEHAPCYHPENANQFLTDARWKYIWNPINGEEQLFDLRADPHECADLAQKEPEVLSHWRKTMARQLVGRQEQLSDGTQLRMGEVQACRFAQADTLHLG
tara:strand:+ start:5826 stop:7055 length:1230 start_codon:yes stop_codon:yes gene_type:complete